MSWARSIAGFCARTSCKKRIQVLRVPVSPSGRRLKYGLALFGQLAEHRIDIRQRDATDEIDDWLFGHGVLPRGIYTRSSEPNYGPAPDRHQPIGALGPCPQKSSLLNVVWSGSA